MPPFQLSLRGLKHPPGEVEYIENSLKQLLEKERGLEGGIYSSRDCNGQLLGLGSGLGLGLGLDVVLGLGLGQTEKTAARWAYLVS